jgi:hypothetical protein
MTETTHTEPLAPVPVSGSVSIGHDLNVQNQAADYGAWATYVTPAAADTARKILPHDEYRHRATIVVNGAAGYVVVGTQAQCQATSLVGGQLFAGQPGLQVIIENNQDLWLVGDGSHSCTVTVLVERWES